MGNFKREKKWYWENHKNLLKKYEGKFVIIYKEKVTAFGKNQIALMYDFYKEYGYVECFCHCVLEEEPIYKVFELENK